MQLLFYAGNTFYFHERGSCVSEGSCDIHQVASAVDDAVKACNKTLQNAVCAANKGNAGFVFNETDWSTMSSMPSIY